MQSNRAFAKASIRLNLMSTMGPASSLAVYWETEPGGPSAGTDPVTHALLSGTVTVSGTLRGFTHQTEGKTVRRQYQEIQAGDLIVDLEPSALVTIYPGQVVSGTVPLDAMIASGQQGGVRFERPPGSGLLYVQADVGERLADAWKASAGDLEMIRTILLRKAT